VWRLRTETIKIFLSTLLGLRFCLKILKFPTRLSFCTPKLMLVHLFLLVNVYVLLDFKQTKQKSGKCSLSHSREQQCSQLVCVNCKQNHSVTSLECPARKRAYAIQKCMTLKNLSRNETKIRYPSLFKILDEVDTNDLTHFPQPTWQRKSAIPVLQNNTKIATQHIFA